MGAIKTWMMAGYPPHWQWFAVAAYVLLEFYLPRTAKLKANSTIELVANMLKPVLGRVPLVGKIVALLGTPEAKAAGLPLPPVTALLPLAFAALWLSGCAVVGLPKNATFAQKLQADEHALVQIATDVGAKCGPQLAAFGKTVAALIAVAATYEDVLADITSAAQVYGDVKMDVAAVSCVVSTVRSDIKALTPSKGAMIERAVAELWPPMCSTRPENDHGACRPVTVDCGTNRYDCLPEAQR